MRNTQFAAGLAACLLALSGCGDSTAGTGDPDLTIPVGAAIDVDNDGKADGTAIDTNGDKIADAIDSNGDGKSDGPIPSGAKPIGGSAMSDDAGGGTTGGSTMGGTTGGVDAGATTGGMKDAGATTGGTKDAGTAACDTDKPGNDCQDAVQCGKDVKSCDIKTSACCATGTFPNLVFTCSAGSKCAMGSQAVCDGPEECGGKACCVEVPAGNVKCKDSCGVFDSQLCHKDADCPSSKGTCKPGGTYSFWGVCS